MSARGAALSQALRSPAARWTLLGLLALFAGLVWLLSIFAAERAAARVRIDQHAETLSRFAHLSFSQTVLDTLRAAELSCDAAERDPLLPAGGCRRWRENAQVVPPPPPSGPERNLAARFEALHAPTPQGEPPTDPDDPAWARERLRAAVFAALAAPDVSAVAHGFRALLAHRTRFVLPVALDLPGTLAVVEGLSAAGGFEPQTLAQVLHEGVEDRHGRALEGLQRLLLRRRSAFSQADFDILLNRMVAVSAAVGAPTAELRTRAAESSPAAGSDPEIDQTLQVAAVSGTGWASWTAPRGTFDAVPFDARAALEAVARPLRARGLLRPGEALHLDLHGARAQALASLQVRCDGPAFEVARADADAAFVWKTALLALTALFAVLAAGLGLSAGRRRQRYLDLKTEFVSTVSHELRTPLASVRALAETLDRRLADEPRARDYPRRIVRAIDGLTGLVENILSFNRLEQDRVQPRLERVVLDDLLSAVAEEVADQAPRAVDWQVTGVRGLVLQADPALLLLLVSNLCRNGWKYNARDPIALRVHVSRVPAPRPSRPAGLRIEVHDNGQGVPAVAVPHLFTAFYRAPGTSDRRGSGLGLALCWRAAQAHGGRIALARTSPEGSVFALDLPGEAVQEDSAGPEVPAARSE